MTLGDVQARLKADALEPSPLGAVHMDKFIRTDLQAWQKVVRQQGIKLDTL
jgi:tripartite-type tricarboxylate transporter receptor subunit TctC